MLSFYQFMGDIMALLRMVFCLGLLFTAASCNRDEDNESAYVEQKKESNVAIVPVFDRTENAGVTWNLSDEITSGLRRRLKENDKLSLTEQQKVHALTKKFVGQKDPFATDISWVKHSYPCCQFVVFTEVLEHEEVPASFKNVKSSPATLNMSVKIRILDNRGQKSKVILQEIVHNSHNIPKQFNKTNFQQIPWGKENYHVTPVGVAHSNLIKEIATRIEDYILLAIGE